MISSSDSIHSLVSWGVRSSDRGSFVLSIVEATSSRYHWPPQPGTPTGAAWRGELQWDAQSNRNDLNLLHLCAPVCCREEFRNTSPSAPRSWRFGGWVAAVVQRAKRRQRSTTALLVEGARVLR